MKLLVFRLIGSNYFNTVFSYIRETCPNETMKRAVSTIELSNILAGKNEITGKVIISSNELFSHCSDRYNCTNLVIYCWVSMKLRAHLNVIWTFYTTVNVQLCSWWMGVIAVLMLARHSYMYVTNGWCGTYLCHQSFTQVR